MGGRAFQHGTPVQTIVVCRGRGPGCTMVSAGNCLHLGCETVRLLGNVNRMMLFFVVSCTMSVT